MTRLAGVCLVLLAFFTLVFSTACGDDKKEKEIDAIFRKLDTNNDGKLTRDEFLKMAERFRDQEKARTHLEKTFNKLDPNNRGLTRDQFRTLVETSMKKKMEK